MPVVDTDNVIDAVLDDQALGIVRSAGDDRLGFRFCAKQQSLFAFSNTYRKIPGIFTGYQERANPLACCRSLVRIVSRQSSRQLRAIPNALQSQYTRVRGDWAPSAKRGAEQLRQHLSNLDFDILITDPESREYLLMFRFSLIIYGEA